MNVLQTTGVPLIVALLSGLIPGIIAIRQANRKSADDARAQYYADIRKDVDAAGERIDKLQTKYDELREEYDTLREDYGVLREDFTALNGYVGDLEGYIDELQRIMKASGLTAPPRPKRPLRRKPGGS